MIKPEGFYGSSQFRYICIVNVSLRLISVKTFGILFLSNIIDLVSCGLCTGVYLINVLLTKVINNVNRIESTTVALFLAFCIRLVGKT